MKDVVFVPVKDDINSQKDDWYVMSGVPNETGLLEEQKKFGTGLTQSMAECLCVMSRLAVNRFKELNK